MLTKKKDKNKFIANNAEGRSLYLGLQLGWKSSVRKKNEIPPTICCGPVMVKE